MNYLHALATSSPVIKLSAIYLRYKKKGTEKVENTN